MCSEAMLSRREVNLRLRDDAMIFLNPQEFVLSAAGFAVIRSVRDGHEVSDSCYFVRKWESRLQALAK